MLVVGFIAGMIVGALIFNFFRLPLEDWPRFIESVGTGFGIGLALVTVVIGLNFLVKFMDRQAQKVKSSSAE